MSPGVNAAMAAAFTLGTAACSATAAQGPSVDGPVNFTADERFVQTAYVHANGGQRVVFGATSVRNDGDAAATLAAGKLEGNGVVDAGADLVEVRVLDISGGGDLVGAARWPFEHYQRDSVPLHGFKLPPGGEAELLFVFSVERTGVWHWPQTVLNYKLDGKIYQARTNTGFLVCPSNRATCAPPS